MDRKVVIIGSGIAGMSAAIYLKRAGIDTLIIEKEVAGGQLNKTNVVENYPGYVRISGPELAFNIYNQVNELAIDYLYDEVVRLEKRSTSIYIKTKKSELTCKYLIIATGRAPRKLNLDNEDRLIGRGISYCALCDGALYKNKQVAIIGGGNSAVEDAIYLASVCNKVTLIHRRNTMRAEEKLVSELEKLDNVEILYDTRVVEYIDKDNKISKLKLSNNQELEVDGVFVAIGYEPICNMIELDNEDNYIIVNDKCESSISNIYAIGDAIKKDIYQLVTAASDGVNAAVDIIKKDNISK